MKKWIIVLLAIVFVCFAHKADKKESFIKIDSLQQLGIKEGAYNLNEVGIEETIKKRKEYENKKFQYLGETTKIDNNIFWIAQHKAMMDNQVTSCTILGRRLDQLHYYIKNNDNSIISWVISIPSLIVFLVSLIITNCSTKKAKAAEVQSKKDHDDLNAVTSGVKTDVGQIIGILENRELDQSQKIEQITAVVKNISIKTTTNIIGSATLREQIDQLNQISAEIRKIKETLGV